MTQPLILHIETSGEYCSVALSQGPNILSVINSTEKNNHSTALAPDAQRLLGTHDIEPEHLHAISVSGGPGSYTGLRVGVSFAKAMCFALDIPLIAVDTLESLAVAARKAMHDRDDLQEGTIYYSNIDARRMEVYVAAFDASGKRILPNSAMIVEESTFTDFTKKGKKIVFCGTGTSKCTGMLTDVNIIHYPMQCKAEHLVAPALHSYEQENFADLVSYRPDYVKAPNITVSTKPLL